MNIGKHLILTCMLCLAYPGIIWAQAFYIDCADDRAFAIVMKVVQYLKYEVTGKPDQYDFSIRCVLENSDNYNKPYKGYMIIYNQSGAEIVRTKTIKRKACAANGFNAAADIFQVLAENNLPGILEKLTTIKQE